MVVLVDLEQVSAHDADRVLFDRLSLTVKEGDRIGIVGSNGAGKSTLLRLVAGVDPPFSGSVRHGRGVRVGYLPQHVGATTGRPGRPGSRARPILPHGPDGPAPVAAAAPEEAAAAPEEEWPVRAMLDRLGVAGADRSDPTTLSGGEEKRVALARVLASPAELLVLDEPTNHLDLVAIAWLERHLARIPGALVVVSHDRQVLDRVTTRMVELDGGHHAVHEGGYQAYLESRSVREGLAARADAAQRNLARRELAWLRRGAPARSRKPTARVDAARRLLATVSDESDTSTGRAPLDLGFPVPRLGRQVIECHGVTYRYGQALPPVLDRVDLALGRRERLGLIGTNGSGKSTLLDVLAGRRSPTAGEITVGPTVVVGYYDQRGVTLDPEIRVCDAVAGTARTPVNQEVTALMERFLFTGPTALTRVGSLSGGERRRLQLLLVLSAHPNVLLLDEPTNDLDLGTLRALEELVESWPGAVVAASHDRAFLERTTGRVVSIEAGGMARPVAGGVAAWIEAHAGPEVPAGTTPARSGAPRPAGPRRPARDADRARTPPARPLQARLREAGKAVAAAERERDRLVSLLQGTSDRFELARIGSELAAAQHHLEEAEDRWLGLADEADRGA